MCASTMPRAAAIVACDLLAQAGRLGSGRLAEAAAAGMRTRPDPAAIG